MQPNIVLIMTDQQRAGAFDSVYGEVGFGGEHYREHDRPPLHFPYEGPSFDELNSVTQSGKMKMLRKGDWKLTFDYAGHGELYHLASDPYELTDRFDDPACAGVQREMLADLLRWTIATEDDLPAGKYLPKPYRPARTDSGVTRSDAS